MKQITKTDSSHICLIADTEAEHIQAIHVYEYASRIVIQITLGRRYKKTIDDVLQYLEPDEALALAQALISCARIAASAATVPSFGAKA